MRINKTGQAGSLESSDILVTLTPAPGDGITVKVKSDLEDQFGEQIRKVIEETIRSAGLQGVTCYAEDKGALDYTIVARVEAAIARAAAKEEKDQ